MWMAGCVINLLKGKIKWGLHRQNITLTLLIPLPSWTYLLLTLPKGFDKTRHHSQLENC